MSVAWSWAFDTPFKWTKQVASHFGGTRQGMAMAWPARIKDAGGIRSQFHHMIDIVPTILEASGITAPVTVNGVAQKPIEGVSMAYTWDKANADAAVPARHAIFRDVRQPRHLPRRLDRRDDAAAAALADGHRQDAGRAQWLQLGTLQHRGGLLREQRPRRQDARQAARHAAAFPGRGGEIRRLPARQLDPRTHRYPAAERDRRAHPVHLFGRAVGPRPEQRPEHPEPVVHDHGRRGDSRERRRRA